MNVYYLGPEGTFSHILTKQLFDDSYNLVPCLSLTEAIKSLDSNSLALLPYENSTTSNVHQSIDLLIEYKLGIVQEAILDINLNLISRKGSSLDTIETVLGPPIALLQCSNFIEENNLKLQEVESTAAAQEIVSNSEDLSLSAIGSRYLFNPSQTELLKTNIGNYKNNKTRFVVVKNNLDFNNEGDKVSIIFKLNHQPGALAAVLNKITELNCNLTQIESRPIPETNLEYSFWVDLELNDLDFAKFESEIKAITLECTIVGRYFRGKDYQS